MTEPEKVTGSDCLKYIKRPIGFIDKEKFGSGVATYLDQLDATDPQVNNWYNPHIQNATGGIQHAKMYKFNDNVAITKFNHDINKRKVGIVRQRYNDGGYFVVVLGNENCNYRSSANCENYYQSVEIIGCAKYTADLLGAYDLDDSYNFYCEIGTSMPAVNSANCYLKTDAGLDCETIDKMIEWTVTDEDINRTMPRIYTRNCFNNATALTTDPTTTLTFGEGRMHLLAFKFYEDQMGDPLKFLQGDMYYLCNNYNARLHGLLPKHFDDGVSLYNWNIDLGINIVTTNLVAVPYNLILTNSYEFAQEYLNNGTVPPDAFLFPLDWNNLPSYTSTIDNPDDVPNDNTPGDNDRDITPNLPVVPTFTPTMLSNYNWYWLDVSQYSDFINWFWNDIGDYSDFNDIINKVKGLYNDVASAVLMVRYFPVEYEWITNLDVGASIPTGNILLGMIEKQGAVSLIDQTHAPKVRDIGHIHIPKKYKSFCDLPPYTQLSLYLPYHGFVDLDADIMVGHDLYIKGVYDYLTGTLQYLLYYDNTMLINTFIVKLAVDIPITLQTKNDRDSATFQNVSNAVSGLIGAGAGIMSGNPIGMAIGVTQGVNAFNSANSSAPLNVKGTVGEVGAMYSPPQCAIILRRPTIQSSDKGDKLTTWKHNIGQLCGYGYKMSGLNGSGFTVCHSPRIEFNSTCPLQSEVNEIYDYLEKGVIL